MSKDKKCTKPEYNIILVIIGLFLLVDAIFSIYYGMNDLVTLNSPIGMIVRVIRGVAGGYLVWRIFKK